MQRVSVPSRKAGCAVKTRIQPAKTWRDSGGMAGIEPKGKPKGKIATCRSGRKLILYAIKGASVRKKTSHENTPPYIPRNALTHAQREKDLLKEK